MSSRKQEGGPIAPVADGDEIIIDAEKRLMDLVVDESVLWHRRSEYIPKPSIPGNSVQIRKLSKSK
jgi:dihydroxyacid dehydratase/phosphogluconate dehydratase